MKKLLCLRSFLLSCLACFLFLVPVIAHAAPYIYTYTGNYFDEFVDNNPPAGQYTSADRVVVSLTTIDGLLPETTSSVGWEVISSYLSTWTFTDGRQVLDPSNSFLFSSAATIDAAGQFVDWNLQAEYVASPTPTTYILYNVGTVYTPDWFISAAQDGGSIGEGPIPGFQDYQDIGQVKDAPGVWSARAVPEPTTMLLFGAGLLGLAGFGRKKFKK